MSSQVEEFIPGGYPVTPQHENTLEDMENNNIESNAENNTTVDKDVNAENKNVENKTAKNDVEKNKAENDVENKKADDIENKAENIVKINTENDVEKKAENNKDRENKENKDRESKENKDRENKENKELENKENIAKSFPLKFEPNSSVKPADDNNFTNATPSKGSSALGGIGINPTTLLGIGSDSPPHPFYQESGELKSQKSEKTFDLNGDYNEQKEKEQIADKQEQQKPKDERVDLGIKPLGNQPLPSPYKPEDEVADRSVHKQTEGAKGEMTPGKTTAVHPESQNVGPRITKKDKINATIGKAVGVFKQKIGKLVKNDDLVAKGTEKKAEADETKEIAEVQKKMNEF